MLRFPAIARQHDNMTTETWNDLIRFVMRSHFKFQFCVNVMLNCNKIWLQYPTVQCDLIINRRRLIRSSCEPMRNFHAFQFKWKLLKSWIQNIMMWRAKVYTMLCTNQAARGCFGTRGAEIHRGVTLRWLLCVSRDGHLFNPLQCWFLNPEWSFRTQF